jgi:hypothetical protein
MKKTRRHGGQRPYVEEYNNGHTLDLQAIPSADSIHESG